MKTKLFLAIVLLTSCKTAWHYERINKKDPNFWSQFNDTIQIPFKTYDTIYQDGDTIAIIERIEYRDTIIRTRTISPKSRFDYKSEALQLRHALKMENERTKQLAIENRTFRTKLKQENKTERADIRQTNRTERTETRQSGKTFLLCLISFVVGCLIGMAFMFKYRINVLRWLRGF